MTFYAPPDDAGGAGTELKEDPDHPPGSTLADVGPVEGEIHVDFSKLGAPPAPPEAPEGEDEPEPDKKATTGQPEAPASPKKAESKAQEPAKPEKKAQEPKKEAGEPSRKAAKAEAVPEEEPLKDEKLPSVEEIEAMQTKAGAPEAVVKHFGGLKAVTKRYAQLYKESQTALEAEKAKKATLAEDQAKELEELRANRMIFEEETSPEVQDKVQAKFKEADASLFGLLKSPALGLNDKGEKMVRSALDNYTPEHAQWLKEKILDKITDPVTRARVEQGIVARFNAIDDQQRELAKLRENKETWRKDRAEQEKKRAEEWANKARAKAQDLATRFSWMAGKEIPEGASKEVKAAAEAHNARIEAKTKDCQELIAKVYGRDPEALTEVVFKSFHADHVEEKNKELESDLSEAKKRVEELEALVGDARDAGRQKASSGGAEPATGEEAESGIPGGDAESALNKFFAKRQQR